MEKDEVLIGYCGVDSGSIIIVDPCYAMPDTDTNIEEWKKDNKTYSSLFDDLHKGDPNWQKQFKNVIFSGVGGDGIVMHTYDGDGTYPVYAKLDKNGRVMEARIVFYDPNFEEEEEEESVDD